MSPAYLLKDLLTGLFGSLALLGKECNHLASHPLRGEEEIINLVTKSPPRTEFSSLALLLCCCVLFFFFSLCSKDSQWIITPIISFNINTYRCGNVNYQPSTPASHLFSSPLHSPNTNLISPISMARSLAPLLKTIAHNCATLSRHHLVIDIHRSSFIASNPPPSSTPPVYCMHLCSVLCIPSFCSFSHPPSSASSRCLVDKSLSQEQYHSIHWNCTLILL